ncbi:MAG: dihydroorotase [Ferruginibacter sp.]
MKVIIKHANIICSTSAHHGQVKDILLHNGIIEKIADNIMESADQIIEHPGLHISIGWMDMFAHFTDPGLEHRETLVTGANAAAAGGFTDVMILPNTQPVIGSKSMVEYLRQKAATLPVNILPIGSLTKNAEGKELTEMYDMHASGAVAFSDGIDSVQSPGLLLKALQYVLPIEACIIQIPDDQSIGKHGLMNEGIVSTQLGLPAKPSIAEEIMIARDIELLKYTKSRLHITGVSTRKGIELICAAKKDGLQLTCSVTPAHLIFCDEDLNSYDSNLKLNPPLRTSNDRTALREAFQNGDIDCIASHHLPQHWDDKTCEFEYAKYGSTSLETVFGVARLFKNNITDLIYMMTVAPRAIVGLPLPEIKEGIAACFTLFTPDEVFVFDEKNSKSTSLNNAFAKQQLKGKVVGIINKNQICLNQ